MRKKSVARKIAFSQLLILAVIVFGLGFLGIFIRYGQSRTSTSSQASGAVEFDHEAVELGEMRITDWSPDGKRLLGYKKDAAGVFQIYTWDTAGQDEQMIPVPTGVPGLSSSCHKGFPHYDPTGKYVLVTVEMDFGCPKVYSQPGLASSTNLWVVELRTNTWTNLTKYAFPRNVTDLNGALSPYFSNSGKQVLWAKILQAADTSNPRMIFGKWEMHLADFSMIGVPHLENDRVLSAGDGNIYEPHGFSQDDQRILFSSDIGLKYSAGLDIWELNLSNGQLTNITNSDEVYDEHARYLFGTNNIVYGSTACCRWYNPKYFLASLSSESYLRQLPSLARDEVTREPERLTRKNYGLDFVKRSGNWSTAVSPEGDKIIVWQQFYDGSPDKSWVVSL